VMHTLEYGFFVLLVLAAYPLAGYPLVVWLVSVVRPRPVRRGPHTPSVTILIPAFNEADCIARCVENKLKLDYPRDKVEIIVVSDASDDGTDEIVKGYEARGVKLLRREERKGKAAGLNAAIRHATGDIVVFSDANSEFAPDALRLMMENFADPEVGYVTGRLTLRHDKGNTSGQGSGTYIRYENWLRAIETRAASVIGVNGGVDAMRRELYADVPADQITDFVLPLRVIAAGRRVVYDSRAASTEEANEELDSEFRMRVRVALRALRGLVYMKAALNVWRAPLPAFCIFSHKVLRYLSFVFLLCALLVNIALATQRPLFAWILVAHLLFYVGALTGLSGRLPAALRRLTVLPCYFVVSNAAFAVATLRFARGDVVATWRPRAG